MPDQVDVSLEVTFAWNHFAHQAVGLFIRALFWNQTKSPGYTEDVSVYGKHRAIAREQQGASDGLRSDPFEAREKLFGVIKWRAFEKREIERPASFVDVVKQLLNANRLLSGKAARSYRGFDRRHPRAFRRLPGGKPLFQALERTATISVGGGLGENRLDEDVKRVESALRLRHTVDCFEILKDVRNRLRRIGTST